MSFDRNNYRLGYTPDELDIAAAEYLMHPALKAALRWLADDGHLTGDLKSTNNGFGHLAINVAIAAPSSPQSTIAVHKLVEAKDAAIRAWIDTQSSTANFVSPEK